MDLNGADTAFSLILKKQNKMKVMNSLVITIHESEGLFISTKEQD